MKKLTHKEIERLLSARGTPEPPEGLADRIKAEIPEVLQVGGTGLEPENVRAMPPRSAGLRPFWLIAASLLVVIGAGFMVVRLLGPSEDLAQRIALDGVTIVKDVVISVPERSTIEGQKLASAMALEKPAEKSARPAAPQQARGAAADESATLGKTQPAAEAEARDAGGTLVAGNEKPAAVVLPPNRAAEEVAIAGYAAVSNEARSVAPADKMERVAAPAQAASGSIIVVVQDAAGKPVAGAFVRLDLADRRDANCGSREAGAGGAASFCCVAPGTYRLCAQLPGFVAVVARLVVTPGAQLNVPLTMNRPPADGKEHPWTCPTPGPPASR
jgi:hypothetical protein